MWMRWLSFPEGHFMSMKLIFENWRRFEEVEQLIQEKSIMKEQHPFKAMFIVGPAGAGKGYIGQQIGVPEDFFTVNTDERVEDVFRSFNIPLKFEPSPKKGGDEDMNTLQQNARIIMQNASRGHVTNMIMKGAPLLFDTTGQDVAKISGRINSLVGLGYDVAILQVNVPPEVSVQRDIERGEEGGREVGAELVTQISNDFQQNVVKDQGYMKSAEQINKSMGGPYVAVLGGAVFPNIFALADFKGKKKGELTVSPEAAAQMGNPSFQQAQGILEKAKQDMAKFMGETKQVKNPTGQAIYQGMMSLIKLTGGKQGQNMGDLFATKGTEFAKDPAIQKAVQVMGGNPSDLVKGATRGEKTPVQPSVRGLAKTFGKKHGVRTAPDASETK